MSCEHHISTPPPAILPEPTLRRLPWYLSYVRLLGQLGVEYVSTTQISKQLNVDASQIAKDLSFLPIRGKTRIGYHVATLTEELLGLLGFQQQHKAVVIGAGSLGAALMHDNGLAQYGLRIVAGFDVKPSLVGTSICGIPVYHADSLAEQQEHYRAAIAILTVPAEHSQQAADRAIASGIHALWNFTPFRITAPEGVVIANTSIYAHLALIYNRMAVAGSQPATQT